MTKPTETTEIMTREQQIKVLSESVEELAISITTEAQEHLATLQETFPAETIPEDLSDRENFRFVHQVIQEIKKPRIALEKSRKELVGPFNAVVKKINDAARPIKEAYLDLERPWKQAKKDFEIAEEIRKREEAEAERKRVEEIAGKISWIKQLPGIMAGMTSDDVSKAIDEIRDAMETFDFQEFRESAEEAHVEAAESLRRILADKERLEELERIDAERKSREEEERKRREEEERRRLEEERKAQEAHAAELRRQQEEIKRQKEELRRQQEAIEAERRAREEEERRRLEAERQTRIEEERRQAAEEAERKRREEEERQAKFEAEREAARIKAEEEQHERIWAEIVESLVSVCGLNPDVAGKVVGKIDSGEIKHVRIVPDLSAPADAQEEEK